MVGKFSEGIDIYFVLFEKALQPTNGENLSVVLNFHRSSKHDGYSHENITKVSELQKTHADLRSKIQGHQYALPCSCCASSYSIQNRAVSLLRTAQNFPNQKPLKKANGSTIEMQSDLSSHVSYISQLPGPGAWLMALRLNKRKKSSIITKPA